MQNEGNHIGVVRTVKHLRNAGVNISDHTVSVDGKVTLSIDQFSEFFDW